MLKAGQLIGGKYRLIHPLGMGGMGMVWRAEHETLRQPVALKVLHAPGRAVERSIKRFQREAQIAASIRHRNVVYISDFGRAEDEPYLVMELLQGVPLADRLYVGEPLSVRAFLELMDDTLQGLAAVHAAGIVHRDLKPANIFLARDADGTTHPKLLDFGVSRSTDRDQGHTITVEGMVMGTPEYISPEQARGKVGDQRSDLYSLGVVMYEALAGCLPFRAESTVDLMVAVLNQTPIALHAVRPQLGQALSDVVMRAMEREPERRFQSTTEMRAALRACMTELPAGVALPARVRVQRLTPALSSEPPPLERRLEGLPATLTTEVMQARPARGRKLLIGVGIAATIALALTLATRSPSANARLQTEAPIVERSAPMRSAEPDGSPNQPPSVEAARAPREAKPEPAGRRVAKPVRSKPTKRELLRTPGF